MNISSFNPNISFKAIDCRPRDTQSEFFRELMARDPAPTEPNYIIWGKKEGKDIVAFIDGEEAETLQEKRERNTTPKAFDRALRKAGIEKKYPNEPYPFLYNGIKSLPSYMPLTYFREKTTNL